MEDKTARARELWQRYYMVTTELLKSVNHQDVDEFLMLVDQRTKLMEMLDELQADEYRQSAECQALFEKIKPLDMQIIYKAKSWLNKARRKNLAVRSYDINGLKPVGHLFNQEY